MSVLSKLINDTNSGKVGSSSITLNTTSSNLKIFKPEITTNLEQMYNSDNLNLKILATVLNSIITNNRIIFSLTKGLLAKLLKQDVLININTINGSMYRSFISFLQDQKVCNLYDLEPNLDLEFRMQNRLAPVFILSESIINEFFTKDQAEALLLVQQVQASNFFTNKTEKEQVEKNESSSDKKFSFDAFSQNQQKSFSQENSHVSSPMTSPYFSPKISPYTIPIQPTNQLTNINYNNIIFNTREEIVDFIFSEKESIQDFGFDDTKIIQDFKQRYTSMDSPATKKLLSEIETEFQQYLYGLKHGKVNEISDKVLKFIRIYGKEFPVNNFLDMVHKRFAGEKQGSKMFIYYQQYLIYFNEKSKHYDNLNDLMRFRTHVMTEDVFLRSFIWLAASYEESDIDTLVKGMTNISEYLDVTSCHEQMKEDYQEILFRIAKSRGSELRQHAEFKDFFNRKASFAHHQIEREFYQEFVNKNNLLDEKVSDFDDKKYEKFDLLGQLGLKRAGENNPEPAKRTESGQG